MIILLDSDMVLFNSVIKYERALDVGNNELALFTNTQHCYQEYIETCNEIADRFMSSFDEILHCFTDQSKFRRDIFPAYKASRAETRKPFGYTIVKHDLHASLPNTYLHNLIEADDLISIFSDLLTAKHTPHIIFSGDKDLDQIPGVHAWLNKETYEITAAEGKRKLWLQTLTGDQSDSIPGCPGIGKVGAEKAYGHIPEGELEDMVYWEAAVQCYAKAKVELPEEAAILNHRLVRLLRHDEYDFPNARVNLWTPAI
jgi:DNA polymerase-1